MSDRPTTHITPCELCVAWGVFCKFEFNSRVDLVANHVTRDPTAVRKQSQTRKITEIREGTSSDSKSSRWVGECLAVRFLDLERCSGSCPFSLGFATPGASSDSKSSRCPGGLVKVWRSDFWIWRGAPEVVRLVLVLLLQEPAPTLRVPGGLVKVRRSDFKRNVCVLITEPRSVRDLVAVGSCGTCYSMLLCSMPCSRFVTDPGDPPFDHLQGTGGPKGQSRT